MILGAGVLSMQWVSKYRHTIFAWATLGGWGSGKEVRFVDIFDSGQLGSILETPC